MLPEWQGHLFVQNQREPFGTMKATASLKQYDNKIIECTLELDNMGRVRLFFIENGLYIYFIVLAERMEVHAWAYGQIASKWSANRPECVGNNDKSSYQGVLAGVSYLQILTESFDWTIPDSSRMQFVPKLAWNSKNKPTTTNISITTVLQMLRDQESDHLWIHPISSYFPLSTSALSAS